MNIRTVFTVFALLAALSILPLVIPATMLSWYGVPDASDMAVLLYRVLAVFSLGIALMAWYARDLPASRARAGIVLGFVVLNAGSAIATALEVMAGLTNAAGWIPVGFFALFAVLFVIAGRSGTSASPG
jgi:peptidoglycan/LPS O-acetylase OafA/YrhL